MRFVIFDTNIWIYLLEGRKELLTLKTQMAQREVISVLTPVVFAEVLGWQEMSSKKEKEIRKYFAYLEMLTLHMEHWEHLNPFL